MLSTGEPCSSFWEVCVFCFVFSGVMRWPSYQRWRSSPCSLRNRVVCGRYNFGVEVCRVAQFCGAVFSPEASSYGLVFFPGSPFPHIFSHGLRNSAVAAERICIRAARGESNIDRQLGAAVFFKRFHVSLFAGTPGQQDTPGNTLSRLYITGGTASAAIYIPHRGKSAQANSKQGEKKDRLKIT